MSIADLFAPYAATVTEVLRHYDAGHAIDDGAHDISHLARVWRVAYRIAQETPEADAEALAVATLLHDCVSVEKNSPDRARASTMAADVARGVLARMAWPAERVECVAHAIAAHSFSAGIAPRSIEACILRDADRLDALGALGIARTFYVAGRLGRPLYALEDPFAERREPDDSRYSIDHFECKLLHLADGLMTPVGQRIGRERTEYMRDFLAQIRAEIEPD